MAKNRMSDLRDHLFEVLEGLKDTEKPLDVERAKAVCQVSKTIIDSAKAEIQYAEAIGGLPSNEFFDPKVPAQPQLKAGHVNGGGRS